MEYLSYWHNTPRSLRIDRGSFTIPKAVWGGTRGINSARTSIAREVRIRTGARSSISRMPAKFSRSKKVNTSFVFRARRLLTSSRMTSTARAERAPQTVSGPVQDDPRRHHRRRHALRERGSCENARIRGMSLILQWQPSHQTCARPSAPKDVLAFKHPGGGHGLAAGVGRETNVRGQERGELGCAASHDGRVKRAQQAFLSSPFVT
jgi:hypothetical protein